MTFPGKYDTVVQEYRKEKRKEANGMGKAEEARANFYKGYNCAQSVLLAFAGECGLTESQAARIGASLGGGMGRLREVCGALSAILVLDGLLEGYETPGDASAKAAHYARVQALAAAFREEHGAILCRELLKLPAGASVPTPEARTPEYYRQRPCPELCASAARIFEEYLRREPESEERGR